jgi:hypothetical protein
MRVIASLFACFAVSLPLFAFGCAPDSAPEANDEDLSREGSALSVPFEVLPFSRNAAEPGITVIKNKTQFKAFFGVAAPADLSFVDSWVVHYSTGVQSTGGYGASITGVERTGTGAEKLLTVHTLEVSPGALCPVTMALTNPQQTVKIKRQAAQIPVAEEHAAEVTDCSEPGFCMKAFCGPGTYCDEATDSCVGNDPTFCHKAKCANGFSCDEAEDACVPRACDPDVANDCPADFECANQIMCITTPCPTDFRCVYLGPCQGIDWAGVCEADGTLKYCDNDQLVTVPCGAQGCAWDDANSYFDCQ